MNTPTGMASRNWNIRRSLRRSRSGDCASGLPVNAIHSSWSTTAPAKTHWLDWRLGSRAPHAVKGHLLLSLSAAGVRHVDRNGLTRLVHWHHLSGKKINSDGQRGRPDAGRLGLPHRASVVALTTLPRVSRSV